MFRFCLLAAISLFLGGCAGPLLLDPNDAHQVSEEVEVEWDPFKNLTVYSGPVFSNETESTTSGSEIEQLALSAHHAAGKPQRFFLRLSDFYDGDWRGFDQAFDLEGHKFHALSVRHHVHCSLFCGYEETLEVELTKDYLNAHRASGITMRLYGPSREASAAFTMPGAYIDGFFQGAFSPQTRVDEKTSHGIEGGIKSP